jgi:hypothetical protein
MLIANPNSSNKRKENQTRFGSPYVYLSISGIIHMENLAFLGKEAPGFAVKGDNVVVMTEPSQFHSE